MAAKLWAPGWYRAALSLPIGALIGTGLVVGVRALYGWEPLFEGEAITTVCLISVPLAFLIGIGCFDYWFRWASGAPTVPEDHSGHGARTWRDYFRVNTDHKVIGIQYIVTTFFFFILGGLMAMLIRAELAQPGTQFVDPNTYNGLFSVHASLMIFLFIIPVFAGIANFVVPLMIGAPDMAFPRLNALSYWMLPVGGVMMALSFFAPGGEFTAWLDKKRGGQTADAAPGDEPARGRVGEAAAGRQLFVEQGCNSCHTLTDADATATVGPDLDELAKVATDRNPDLTPNEYVRQSIVDPRAFVVDGFPAGTMPEDYEQKMSRQEIDALVDYLLEVSEGSGGKAE